jgi:hypothetical protein
MKNASVLFFFLIGLCLGSLKAQDSISVKKNQVYCEVLGNNFYDPNSDFHPAFVSLNYSRKVLLNRCSFTFSLGCGFAQAIGYVTINNRIVKPVILDFPVGVLFKPNYKRNGLWFGAFFIPSLGKIGYRINDGRNQIDYFHNSSWQFSPNLTYQFQSKSEKFFCRLTLSPKFLPPFFTKSIEYGKDWTIVPWGGISIGGGWK